MMTREEVCKIVNDIRIHSDYPWKHNLNYLETHDAEQQQRIEELEQQNEALREALEAMIFIFGHNDGYVQVKAAKKMLEEPS